MKNSSSGYKTVDIKPRSLVSEQYRTTVGSVHDLYKYHKYVMNNGI